MLDNINHALEPNLYLELVKNETDKEKRFMILKKYFTENITRQLYQNMDLLHATDIEFEQFKNVYLLIAKDLFMNILLAADVLGSERQCYRLDNFISKPIDTENEYSICESVLGSES